MCAAVLLFTSKCQTFLAPPTSPPRSLTSDELATYEAEGVVLVRGLLRGDALEHAISAAEAVVEGQPRRFPAYRSISFQGWRTNTALRHVAMDSAAASVAAQCMRLTCKQRLRVMKDALLAFSPGDAGCGWHVDDKMFWPVHDVAPRSDAPVGCNVWIALTPVRTATGGGLAVAPRSARADWREDCRKVIAGEVGGGIGPPRTCDMAGLSPECQAKLERSKALHDMEPGDALVAQRYCFHRSEPFAESAADHPTRLAYSVRYESADAKLFDNTFEAALKAKGLKDGEPVARAGAFYPQVWPRSRPLERLVVRLGLLKSDPQ